MMKLPLAKKQQRTQGGCGSFLNFRNVRPVLLKAGERKFPPKAAARSECGGTDRKTQGEIYLETVPKPLS